MGGPGVESLAPGGVPPAPSPPTPHPIRPRDPGAHTRQGLLLCAEQPEVGVMATAQDRITIYGPKDDCTYIVEFRDGRRRCACDLKRRLNSSLRLLTRVDRGPLQAGGSRSPTGQLCIISNWSAHAREGFSLSRPVLSRASTPALRHHS